MKAMEFIRALLRRTPDGFYRSFKVFYWDIPNNGMSWCGSIYVSKDASETMIRHESGHCRQYKCIGFWKFLFAVVIPSLVGMTKFRTGKITYEQYHQIPSEAEADKLGGNEYFDELGKLQPPLTEGEIQNTLNEKGVK